MTTGVVSENATTAPAATQRAPRPSTASHTEVARAAQQSAASTACSST
jgi:hypothetical protein